MYYDDEIDNIYFDDLGIGEIFIGGNGLSMDGFIFSEIDLDFLLSGNISNVIFEVDCDVIVLFVEEILFFIEFGEELEEDMDGCLLVDIDDYLM